MRDALITVVALMAIGTGNAAASCGPARYFSPTDYLQHKPLRRPHPEFAGFLERATAGNALAQRSVAASYEAGYLVDKCSDKALHWYKKAATGGDEPAKLWLARYEAFDRMRRGPECAGSACPFAGDESGPQLIELYANVNGSFTVPVTIGSATVNAIVDTGATFVSLSGRQAREMGISYSNGPKVIMQTANGAKEALAVTLPLVRVGGIMLRDVQGVVSEVEMPALLGMSFLGRLNVRINQGHMVLAKP